MSYITQILLPKRDNFGNRFRKEDYAPFHARMIEKFHGWARKGQAEGAWLSLSGRLFTDEHWVYEIGHSRSELDFWRKEKERLKAEFHQEEIWIVQYEGRII
ncbi:MAG: hypothetical protein L0215_04380 [Gemmataceae bacterium]|nr:hypothetical protein [Gemmataceae bacterium]